MHWPRRMPTSANNSFVLPEHKILYMSVTKAACTGLKWMCADLAGEKRARFYPRGGAQQSRLMGIHGGRRRWKHVSRLEDLTGPQRADISAKNGWFVFAVVRDPYSRLWSAWQSKFLVRAALYAPTYAAETWYPRVPRSGDDVLADWRAFVEARPWRRHRQLRENIHFRSQVEAVLPRRIDYSRIYDLTEMSALFADLHEHLRGVGRDGPLYTPRANETPLRMSRAALDGGVAETIREEFAADFRAFGRSWDTDGLRLVDGWSSDAIENIQSQAAANERIGDQWATTRRLRGQLREVRRQLR